MSGLILLCLVAYTNTHSPIFKDNINIGVLIGRVPNVSRTQDEEKTETLVTCFISRGFLGSTVKISKWSMIFLGIFPVG